MIASLVGRTTSSSSSFASGSTMSLPGAWIRFEPVMCHNCAFLGKAFCILLLCFEHAFGHKQGKISIDVTGILKHFVKGLLHLFPYAITVRFDHHATAYIGMLRQVCPLH